jgi:hypothetical protein
VGVAQFIFALKSRHLGQFFWKILSGLLYGAVGIMLVSRPLGGVAALTGLLGGLFIAQGVFQMIAAFKVRPVEGWGWVFIDGIWSLLLGVLILAQWRRVRGDRRLPERRCSNGPRIMVAGSPVLPRASTSRRGNARRGRTALTRRQRVAL